MYVCSTIRIYIYIYICRERDAYVYIILCYIILHVYGSPSRNKLTVADAAFFRQAAERGDMDRTLPKLLVECTYSPIYVHYVGGICTLSTFSPSICTLTKLL